MEEILLQLKARHAEKNQADLSQGQRYLISLFDLYVGKEGLRFVRFCLVGLSGLFVNLLLHFTFTDLVGIPYLLGAMLATQGSTLWNFVITDAWVFQDRPQRWDSLRRLLMFLAMNNSALLLRILIMALLTGVLGMHYLVSNLLSILAMTLVRYALADTWIWKQIPLVPNR